MFYPRSPFSKYPELVQHLRPQRTEQLTDLLQWLCLTPQTTTIRVNLLRTHREQFCTEIESKIRSILPAEQQSTFTVLPHPALPDLVTIPPLFRSGDNSAATSAVGPIDGLGEVIVDVACGAAILRGAHLYAPGVLAMPALTAAGDSVNIYADVEGVCKKGTNTQVYESERKLFVGVGVVRMQRYQLFGANLQPSGIAVQVSATSSAVPAIGDQFFAAGSAMLQNLPSVVCGHVLSPQPGETVLDMCAAPGNKTTHLAELMADRGRLIALDKTPNKLALLEAKIAIFGVRSVSCFAYDATKAVRSDGAGDADESGELRPPFAPATFDRILLDAPCSALGNRPQLRNDMSPRMLASYPVVQKKLWRAAVELLRPGGVLVYSTCTVAAAENEGMVAWALDKFGDCVQLVAAEPRLGGPGWSGCGLSEEQRRLVQRFGPRDVAEDEVGEQQLGDAATADGRDTVGFFIAKFVKNAAAH